MQSPTLRLLSLTGAVALLAACAAAASAGQINYDGSPVIIEATVGSGAMQTAVVVDWHSGTTPSHAWLVQWDAPATAADAFAAIGAADGDFDYAAAGGFVTQMDYFDGAEQHEGNSDGWMSFWHSPATGAGPNFDTLFVGIADADLIAGGWLAANPLHAGGEPGSSWPGSAPSVPAPEPSTSGLMLLAAAALAVRRRRSPRS